MASVKRNVTTSRSDKAAATRARMLDAAYTLFCADGFRPTTMEAIAERAGVAVQTLYFTFHTKDELLQAVLDRTVLGDDGLPPPMQPWFATALAEPDVRKAVRGIVGGVGTIFARVAPMLPVFHTVAADAAGAVWRNGEQLRLEGYGDLVTGLAAKSPLRKGLDHASATDLLFVILGPEVYRSLVLERGWTVAAWRARITDTITRELFDMEPLSVRRRSVG